MGKYEKVGTEALEANELEFSGNDQTIHVSLKVLDALSECEPKLPVNYALVALDDAKNILLQLLSV